MNTCNRNDVATDIAVRREPEICLNELNRQLESRIVERTAELSERGEALETARHALRDSEEKYRLVIENVREGIALVQDGCMVFANPRACEITGYSTEELYSIEFQRIVHPDDREQVLSRHQRRLGGETVEPRYDFRVVHKDGTATWLEVGAVLIQWEGRIATLCFFTDISARKQLEGNLRRTLVERETVLEHSMVGIAFLNPEGRVHWANRGMLEMFGGRLDDYLDRSLESLYSSREAYLRVGGEVSSAVRAGQVYETELQLRRCNGAMFWGSISGKAVNPADLCQGTVWVVLDISARKRAEADVQAALAQQKELNHMKSRFVSMTSHEFRTPLSTILSSAELLRHYSERLERKERDGLFDGIETGVMRMTQMLDDVLIIGQADAGRLECSPVALDLERFCRELAAESEVAAEEVAGLRPELRIDIDTGGVPVAMDEKLLRHILGNLLSNALKYSPDGGVVDFSVRIEDCVASFVVADQGIGIPAGDLPKLFESFHRATNVGNIPGTGLGLAIVSRSVAVHGGRIKVESELGRGARFTVKLPVSGLPLAGCEVSMSGVDSCASCEWFEAGCLRQFE